MSQYKVGDKFEISIGEVLTGQNGPLYKIRGFNSLVFDDYGLNQLKMLEPEDEDDFVPEVRPGDYALMYNRMTDMTELVIVTKVALDHVNEGESVVEGIKVDGGTAIGLARNVTILPLKHENNSGIKKALRQIQKVEEEYRAEETQKLEVWEYNILNAYESHLSGEEYDDHSDGISI